MRMSASFYLLCLLGCGLLAVHCGPGSAGERSEMAAIEQQIAAALPLQSTSEQVLEYLDREKIEHSESVQRASDGRVINAIIRHGRTQWRIVYTDYAIVFRFDADNRLVAREVKPARTGP